jgi:hypothetical protein
MSESEKEYRYGYGNGRVRKQVAALPVVRTITADTKLVSIEDASRMVKEDKGLDLSVWTIRQRCASAKWAEGVFWVKPLRQYLINVQAIYEAIARGDRL